MHLIVRHVTRYQYAEPALRVIQALRLWPAPCAGQTFTNWRVDVNGRRLPPTTTDGFGNPVATHTATGPVSTVRIEVQGRVETEDRDGVLSGSIEPLPPRYFLYETALTAVNPAIRELAAQADSSDGDIARLHQLCNVVRDRVDYIPEQTDAKTAAAEALARGAGVCQDHAHLMAACARTLGFPARYVSGYLCVGGGVDEAASHAWAEVYVNDVGWVGFDAANRICPNEHYIRIACGRDYRDAAPVRGLQQGGLSETLEVSVEVFERVPQQ
ncbi:MAG: transglutaminase family protein [Rhodanobacteraceae bacterium]